VSRPLCRPLGTRLPLEPSAVPADSRLQMESRRRIVELKGIRRLAFVLLVAPALSGAGAALAGPAHVAAPSTRERGGPES
jgi:hypothetical protein